MWSVVLIVEYANSEKSEGEPSFSLPEAAYELLIMIVSQREPPSDRHISYRRILFRGISGEINW